MAKNKKDLDKLNNFNNDPFDFGSFDDFGYSGEDITNDRNPVAKVRGQFKKGIGRKLTDTSFQKELLRRSLPKDYETGFDIYDTLDHSFRDLNEKVKRELKPGLQELRNLSRKVFPGKIPLVPEKLYKKYNEWLDQKEYRGESQQERDEAMTSMMLGEVFSNQAKIQEAERQEDNVREEIKTLTEKKRFEVSHIERVRTNSLLASLVNYQDKVTTSYSRRMLELQFKSYLTQVRLLEAVKETGERTNKELEAITKNTGLPDFVKLRNTEAVKEMTRRKLIDAALESTVAGRVSGLGKRLLTNLTKNIGDAAGYAGFGVESLASAGNSMSDMDDRPSPKNLKEVMERAAEMGGEHVVPAILGHYLGKGADRLRGKFGDSAPGSFGHRISRGGSLLDYYVRGGDQHLQNASRHGVDGVLGTLLSMADADKEVFRSRSGLTHLQYGADRFGGALGNTGTTIATEEVVPGWLQRIWAEIHMLRTGTSKVEHEIYDQKHKKFVKTSRSASELKGLFKSDYNKDYIDKEIGQVIVSLTGSKTLSAKAKAALARKIRLDIIEGITPTPEKYRFIRDLPKDVSLEIRKAIETNFGYDPITEKMDTTKGTALNKRRAIFRSSRALMGQFGGVQSQALRMLDEGKLDSLRRLGIIKETKDGLSLDYNKYLEMIDSGYDFGDLDLTGLNPTGPRRPTGPGRKTGYRTGTVTVDLYLRGEESPVLFANKLKTGKYKDSSTGKPITDISKLKGDILDEHDNIVLEKSAWKAGLYDASGKKVVIGFDAGYELHSAFGDIKKSRPWRRFSEKSGEYASRATGYGESIYEKTKDLYVKGEVKPRILKTKLEAGEYFDKASGRVIKSFQDIKGDVVDRYNDLVISSEDIRRGLVDDAGNIATGLKDRVSAASTMAREGLSSATASFMERTSGYRTRARNFGEGLYAKAKDLYVSGEIRPRVLKAKLEAGEYLDKASGKVITKIEEIKGEIVDKEGNLIITSEDIKKGLTDIKGNKVVSQVSSFMSSDKIDSIKRKVTPSAEQRDKLKEAHRKVSRTSGKAYDGLKTNLTGSEKLLQDIYRLLNYRQPGMPDSHLGSTRTGDLDGDGIRDGSWRDILRKRREKGEGVQDPKDPKSKKDKKDKDDEKSGGIMGGLMAMLGLRALGGKGVGAIAGMMGRVLGKVLGKGVLGAAKLALRLALNPVGTILGAGKGLLRLGAKGIMKGTGMGLRAGARALPTIAKGAGRAALWGARLAVPLMMSPIGLAVTGAALAAYGGYRLYKHYKKVNNERSNALTYLRMAQYGIDPEDKEQVEKLLMLEEMREKDFKRPGEDRPYNDPESYEDIQRIFFTWGADPANQMHQVRVADWYNNRGGPVMSVWSNALYMLKGYHKLSDIDRLSPTEKRELLRMVSIPADDPYSAINFPMIPKDGSEAAAQTAEDVEKRYDKAVKTIDEEIGKQKELLRDNKKPMSRKEARNRRRNKALLEKEARDKVIREKEGIRDYGFGVMKEHGKGRNLGPVVDLGGFAALTQDMLTKDYDNNWAWPVRQGTISSEFGMRRHPKYGTMKPHNGIDIAAPEGTFVYAAANGKVSVKGYVNGYGNAIYITHKDGKVSRYAHLADFADGIEVGAEVYKGQVIGYVGSTGVSTGPHLHFEIREGESNTSTAINPMEFINDEFKREQVRVTNIRKQEADQAPGGYGQDEGAELEGQDTIISTAKPNANPIMDKDAPLMLQRDYFNKDKLKSQVSNNPDSPFIFNKDKTDMAYNADMLDIGREQSQRMGRVGEGIDGMTSEQRTANETLNRIANALENNNKTSEPMFRKQNQGARNPTMGQTETLDSMYKLAMQNNLNPRNYLTEEQISQVSPGIKSVAPTQLGRTSAIMTY